MIHTCIYSAWIRDCRVREQASNKQEGGELVGEIRVFTCNPSLFVGANSCRLAAKLCLLCTRMYLNILLCATTKINLKYYYL